MIYRAAGRREHQYRFKRPPPGAGHCSIFCYTFSVRSPPIDKNCHFARLGLFAANFHADVTLKPS